VTKATYVWSGGASIFRGGGRERIITFMKYGYSLNTDNRDDVNVLIRGGPEKIPKGLSEKLKQACGKGQSGKHDKQKL